MMRARDLAVMHQRLLQLHVGFIMNAGDAAKLQGNIDALSDMSERDTELAWFWFRGAVAALGGALRGRTVRKRCQRFVGHLSFTLDRFPH